jgi:hypothetical protein
MDPAQMQAFANSLIVAATASTNAANLTAATAVPPAAASVPFALLPGKANLQPLDWTKVESMKLFNKAIC